MPLSSRSPAFARRRRVLATVVALVGGALLLDAPAASAHEVPARVGIRVLARVDATGTRGPGGLLRIVVRAPLASMRDVEFPVRPDSTLDLARLTPSLREAAELWVAPALGLSADGTPLPTPTITAVRVALPNDRALDGWERALAALRGGGADDPGDPSTAPSVPWTQADMDVLLELPLPDATARIALEPALAHLGVRTTTVLRFTTADGAERAFTWEGNPGRVELDPRWHVAARRFVALGVEHIVIGIDHLLFLLCLVLPFRQLRPLIAIVTAFTVAHSLTLVASALGYAPTAGWFPPLVEVVIAASIVWMALENIIGPRLERRWAMAFGFGLVHGFGFSFALGETLQFAGSHLALSLASFNLGVELGQVALVALAVPLLGVLFRHVVAERMGVVILSAFVAHEAWHWTTERWADVRAFPLAWPAFDALLLAQGLRLLAAGLVVLAVGWGLGGVMRWVIGNGNGRRGDERLETGRLETVSVGGSGASPAGGGVVGRG